MAIDPVFKLLLTLDVEDRTLGMAQSAVHRVIQGWPRAVYPST